MVDWRGRTQTMLEHVINTVPFQYKQITVALPSDLVKETKALKVKFVPCVIGETKGPAQTALHTLMCLNEDSTLIMDVDVLNFTNDLHKLSLLAWCGVLVSWAANPAFSYVDKLGTFTRIVEKRRISEYAVRGAYFIPLNERKAFIHCLEETVRRQEEPFISHAFANMPSLKYAVKTTYTPYEWGTPRDVKLSGAHIVSKPNKVKQDVCD
jgi:hypothetical protein